MDPAFLRRLPYKIEIGAAQPELYKRIFEEGVLKTKNAAVPMMRSMPSCRGS